MRLAIIGSSGGSALVGAIRCLKLALKTVDIVVVTDRQCGLLHWAQENSVDSSLIHYETPERFSSLALTYLQQRGAKSVLLFFTRRVSAPLIGGLPIYNIHPTLLPAFPGLEGFKAALNAETRFIGATLHVVDAALDSGPIVAQIAQGRPLGENNSSAAKVSYLQKIYLTLLWYELLHDFDMSTSTSSRTIQFGSLPPTSLCASPCLSDPALIRAFEILQQEALVS